MNVPDKKELRRAALARRRGMSPEEVVRRSALVHERIWSSGVLAGRGRVALYAAADNEVLTRPLFDRLRAEGREVFLPKVRGRGPEIDFFRVMDWEGLVVSRLGIPEPAGGEEPARVEDFDFIAVPGVAFDLRGGRLGYGMGCYDRVLGLLGPGSLRVGIGYDFQVVELVPTEAHDVALDAVASESSLVFPSGNANKHKG